MDTVDNTLVTEHRLARKLRTREYFTIAFGTMIGVGWLIVIDDWLTRGGPLGAILAFCIGGLCLLPVGYVYGKFVRAIPDSGAEIAYTSAVFNKSIGFIAGWLMTLAYLIVCPWEAVAIGKIVSYLIPGVATIQIYSIAGKPVFLPALMLGFATTAVIVILNYRGIALSAKFQNYTTVALLISFCVFTGLGLTRVETQNFEPLFATVPGFVSVILVLQIVPYFLTGFESVAKCVEEADKNLDKKGLSRAIFLSLGVGILFYVLILLVVSGLVPWKSVASERYATAVAFERAFGSDAIVRFILIAALFSLLKVFNGNFLAASRLVFALGRGNWIATSFGNIHARFRTPHFAVLFCAVITFLGTILGDAILIPVTEVGSMCSTLGWLMTCLAYLKWRKEIPSRERLIAISGATVAIPALVIESDSRCAGKPR